MHCSVSEIKNFQDCKRRWFYEYLKRMRTTGKALLFGTAWHGALEVFDQGGTLPEVLARADEECSHQFWATDDGAKAHTLLRAMLAAYFRRWEPTRNRWIHIASEFFFDVEVADGIKLVGYIDRIAEANGKTYFFERKTSSDSGATDTGSDYWQKLAIDPQPAAYRHVMGPDVGVVYDVTIKPALRQKKTESLDDYGDRVQEEMTANPNKYFVRRELHATADQRSEQWGEIVETATAIRDYKGNYPRSVNACGRFGSCPFLGVCVGTESLDSGRFAYEPSRHGEDDGPAI